MNKILKLIALVAIISILAGAFANVQSVLPKPDKSKHIPDVLTLELKENVTLEEVPWGSKI